MYSPILMMNYNFSKQFGKPRVVPRIVLGSVGFSKTVMQSNALKVLPR